MCREMENRSGSFFEFLGRPSLGVGGFEEVVGVGMMLDFVMFESVGM